MEVEPNNDPTQAQVVPVPSEIVGQFSEVRDIDTFTFEAKAKDVLYRDGTFAIRGKPATALTWAQIAAESYVAKNLPKKR